MHKFHQYLYGRKFTLITDNKPLISIFGEKKGIPVVTANRLQRYALFLSGYQYEEKYVKSKDNISDFFSRANQNMDDTELCIPGLVQNDIFVNYIQNREERITDFNKIKENTAKDEILYKIIEYIRIGWPEKNIDPQFSPYFLRKNELSEESGAIFWGYRVLIPRILQSSILSGIHSTHLGIVKMKSLARSYFWWPGLDGDLEKIVKSCDKCLPYGNSPSKHKLINWKYPEKPWERIHLDYMGPIFNKYFLVLVDSYSKWIECIDMNNSITSKRTIDQLRFIFSRFGLPSTVVTDNGTSFVSKEFEFFLQMNGIKHITSPVGHPATNGQAENAVKIIKLALKKALHNNNNNENLNRYLQSFLMDYRNTIHCTTGFSPAQIIFCRNIRTRLDLLNPRRDNNIDLSKIKTNIKIAQENQVKNFVGKKIKNFKTNDFVMTKDFSIAGKISWTKGIIIKKLENCIIM